MQRPKQKAAIVDNHQQSNLGSRARRTNRRQCRSLLVPCQPTIEPQRITTVIATTALLPASSLTGCPWPVDGCAMNRVSMRHRRPKHTGETRHQINKVSGHPGAKAARQQSIKTQLMAGIITYRLSTARRQTCHEPCQHALPTTETWRENKAPNQQGQWPSKCTHSPTTKASQRSCCMPASSLTAWPWPVDGCAMNRVSMRYRRPK